MEPGNAQGSQQERTGSQQDTASLSDGDGRRTLLPPDGGCHPHGVPAPAVHTPPSTHSLSTPRYPHAHHLHTPPSTSQRPHPSVHISPSTHSPSTPQCPHPRVHTPPCTPHHLHTPPSTSQRPHPSIHTSASTSHHIHTHRPHPSVHTPLCTPHHLHTPPSTSQRPHPSIHTPPSTSHHLHTPSTPHHPHPHCPHPTVHTPQVQSLVRELKSHMLLCQNKNMIWDECDSNQDCPAPNPGSSAKPQGFRPPNHSRICPDPTVHTPPPTHTTIDTHHCPHPPPTHTTIHTHCPRWGRTR